MDIIIRNKEMWFENNSENIEQLFNSINGHLKKENLQFSHLVIDGEEVYDNFDSHIIENIEKIKKIEVVAMPLAEMVKESLKSAEQYSINAIPVIKNIAEEFYQGPKESTWSQLTDLFGGIQWIIQSLTEINSIDCSDEVISDYEAWNDYTKDVLKFNDVIFELENAVVNKDNVSIGDMLLYEITPIFEAMVEKLAVLVSEVV